MRDGYSLRHKIIFFFLLVSVFLLTACNTPTRPPRQGTAIDDIHASLQAGITQNRSSSPRKTQKMHLPRSVSNALLPSLASSPEVSVATLQNAERRFDISVDKVPAKNFFMGLVEGTPYNMVVNPNVEGLITLNLKNVTIEEAMQAVRDVYGYEYRKTSYGYEILPMELRTQLFSVNYLDLQRTGKSRTQVSSGQISEKVGTYTAGGTTGVIAQQANAQSSQQAGITSSVDTRSEMNFWKDLATTLKEIVGTEKNRSVVVNAQSGIVIVRAFPAELQRVARYLDRIQSNLERQVILEAKVLEVALNDDYQAGIDWGILGNFKQGEESIGQSGNGPLGLGGFNRASLRDFDSIFTINFKGDFRRLVRLLQTQGNVQVLSSPRISTMNNQKAVIKVGQDEFFVTGVSTSNTVAGSATIPSQDVSLTPFFSGVSLDVTPQISNGGEIILHIHPSVSNVTDQTKSIQLGTTANNTPNTLTLPLALSTIRESDNIVRAKTGQVVVIAGLIQNNTTEHIAETPVLGRIPFIGTLFRRTSQVSTKSELVILLRPIIVDRASQSEEMQQTDQRFQGMKRGFHVGGLPDVFGTEGERQ